MQVRLSAALTWFLTRHPACIGEWDRLVAVSSSWREPPYPVESMISRSPSLRPKLLSVLEATSTPPSKRAASDTGYRTTEPVAGVPVLLVDDTFTSGVSVQSAASRLRLDGAEVAGAVVMGRYINPKWGQNGSHLEALEKQRFDWDRCCVHSP